MSQPHSPSGPPPHPASTPAIPALPDNATPEEIDAHWLKYVYQGDQQKQLTFRAVLMGGILGMFMSISNLYTTLKLGWAFGVAITACVMSYVIWNLMRGLTGGRLRQMTMLENNCMQSTASAAGYSTGGTVGAAFGALMLMQTGNAVTSEVQPWMKLMPFVFLTAALGVFLAIPMKRQMINYERLKFPSGIAAAETLRSLYTKGAEAMQKAYSLVIAIIVGGLVGLLRTYSTLVDVIGNNLFVPDWLKSLHGKAAFLIEKKVLIPEEVHLGALNRLQGFKLQMQGLAFEPSVLLIGAGMITGLKVCLSMLGASAALYFIGIPLLYQADQAHQGVAGYVNAVTIKGGMALPTRWALWCGTSIMVFSSLASIAVQWRTLARAFRSVRGGSKGSAGDPIAAVEVPMRWLVIGLIPIGIGMVIVQHVAFDISYGLGAIAVAMSFVVALVCCRATGETDTTPIGAMGKVTQLLYALLPGSRGNAVINLMSAGATSSAGGSSADLLTDLKSGYLLGANPRKQFIAQFIGIFFGTIAIVPAWYLMVPNKEALEKFPNPSANMWKAVAELLTKGSNALNELPAYAKEAMIYGALVGVLIPVLGKLLPRHGRFLPSAMGLGLGLVIPFSNAFSFAIGAVIAEVWTGLSRRKADTFNVPIASGLIAGESLVAAFIAILCTLVGLIWRG